MIELELVRLQVFVRQNDTLKVDIKFHKSLDKQVAIDLLERVIEELKEGENNERANIEAL